MKQSIILAILLAAYAVAISPAAAQTADIYSTKEDLVASVQTAPCDDKLRLDGVVKLFKDAGAKDDEIKIEKFDKDKISNVVVHKRGTTGETVIIGAHFDKTEEGCGALDNWTGVAIISHIYKSIRPLATKKSYIFVAFDQEEKGLRGSSQMVKAMTDDTIKQTCAMINFDSFGMAMPMALRPISSTKMIKLADELAKQNKFDFVDVDIPGASSDSEPFKNKKIPSITLSGLGGGWQDILHSSRDKFEKINMDSVNIGYRFGLAYLSKVDAAVCSDLR